MHRQLCDICRITRLPVRVNYLLVRVPDEKGTELTVPKQYFPIKMERLPPNKKMLLLFHSQHLSAQIDHRQVIRKKYTDSDGIL
jgi:hypothetical protein